MRFTALHSQCLKEMVVVVVRRAVDDACNVLDLVNGVVGHFDAMGDFTDGSWDELGDVKGVLDEAVVNDVLNVVDDVRNVVEKMMKETHWSSSDLLKKIVHETGLLGQSAREEGQRAGLDKA